LSKFAICFTTNCILVITTEVYPTVVRGSMLSFNTGLGYLVASLVPCTNVLVGEYLTGADPD
jgi:hypothetical protein